MTKKTKPMTNADLFKSFCNLSPLAQAMVVQGVIAQFEAVIENKDELLKDGTGSCIVHPQAWINSAIEIKELHDAYQASH